MNPARADVGGRPLTCTSWGLSFFTSKREARTRYTKLLKKRGQLRLSIGDAIATVEVTKRDGVVTTGKNHRNLFEYANTALEWTATEPL